MNLLKLNPEYTGWCSGDDYMQSEGKGFNNKIEKDDFKDLKLNDFNECVNFYFKISRKSKNCSCEDGYHKQAREIVDSFHSNKITNSIGWKYNITEDEYQALLKEKRVDLKNKNSQDNTMDNTMSIYLTGEELNEQNLKGINIHDFIS